MHLFEKSTNLTANKRIKLRVLIADQNLCDMAPIKINTAPQRRKRLAPPLKGHCGDKVLSLCFSSSMSSTLSTSTGPDQPDFL